MERLTLTPMSFAVSSRRERKAERLIQAPGFSDVRDDIMFLVTW
jgi:hypothetical protein